MEIEITHLLEEDMFQFSHSAAEGGQNAGRNTWHAALNGPRPLLQTPEQFQDARDYFRSTGGWDADECTAFTENEVEALLLQFIAGDIREAGADSLDEMDWEEYQADCEAGRVNGNLSRTDDGRVFYSIDS